MRGESIYANLYVKYSHRALRTPRVGRPWRPRVIAWAGPTAFMRDRFYEIDTWYKARIHKPELLPKLHIIDPDQFHLSLSQRLKVHKDFTTNIGFKPLPKANVERSIVDNVCLEKLARKNLLKIDLDNLTINDFNLMDHFQIFKDLFMPGVYFHNTQKLDIKFTDDASSTVHFGNTVSARATAIAPKVLVEKISCANLNGYTTLLMVNLDGDAFTEEDKENDKVEQRNQILHWFIGNIPDARSTDFLDQQFDTIVPYLPPIPFFGTGYHRIVFLLFRHAEKVEFGHYLKDFQPSNNEQELLSRRFNTNLFYKHFEEQLTPTALRFCQIKWDESCDKTLKQLDMKSPRYWYKWNEPLKPKQKEFPLKPMPFQHYLDMYRPPEKVRREIKRKRLELIFEQNEEKSNESTAEKAEETEERLQKPEYPDIFYQDNVKKMSFWQHQELLRRNTGEGKYAALYSDYINPGEQHSIAVSKNDGATPSQQRNV